jgi:hypothetical protein
MPVVDQGQRERYNTAREIERVCHLHSNTGKSTATDTAFVHDASPSLIERT